MSAPPSRIVVPGLSRSSRSSRPAWVAAFCLLLAGCGAAPVKQPSASPAAAFRPLIPPSSAADPVATSAHRTVLDPSHGDIIGELQVTRAMREDTFVDLARRFNVGYEELVRANPGVDPWLPGAGREIVLPTRHILPDAPREGIVINLAAMRLFYFPKRKPGEWLTVYTFPIGIGRVGWATPEGTTSVVRMKKDPAWRPGPGVRAEHKADGEVLPVVVPPGPDNPLGHRAIYLDWPSYLIHGTNKPAGVGLRSSHGCIRLFPEDIELLYDLVKPGTRVTVVNQPFVFGWHEGELLMQAHEVLEDDPRDWQRAQRKLLSKSLAQRIQRRLREQGDAMDWDSVSRVSHSPRSIPVPLTRSGTSPDSVIAEARRVRNAAPLGANPTRVSP
ncbi:MAG: L,D-transpeptidase family protein [Proteobacteria bacterium]|nr:L,D-transpeptidase family protein [Pseudomonadota bacterium]